MRHRPAGKDPPPADTLLQWARRPVRQTNIRIAGVEAWLLAWIVFASRLSGDLVGVLHKTGLTLAVLHLILHALSLIALTRLARAEVPGAEAALLSYRDPWRLSNLDLAAAWAAVGVLGPLAVP